MGVETAARLDEPKIADRATAEALARFEEVRPDVIVSDREYDEVSKLSKVTRRPNAEVYPYTDESLFASACGQDIPRVVIAW